MYAFQQEDVVPDIVTVGKALSSGFAPIAGVLASEKVISALRNGSGLHHHGHTFQAHPVSCAAALAVQETVAKDNLLQNVRDMGVVLQQALEDALGAEKYVGNIRGRGLLWGVEFVKDIETKETFAPEVQFGVRVQQRAFELGVAIYPGCGTVDGVNGDHVLFAPAFTVTKEDIKVIVDLARKAYLDVAGQVERGETGAVEKAF